METLTLKEKALEALSNDRIIGDGHTLFAPSFYAPFFSAEELAEAGLIEVHVSDGTHKGSMTDSDGNYIDKLEAVYNLHFLEWLNAKLGTGKYATANGRGFQAQQLVDFIKEKLAEQ